MKKLAHMLSAITMLLALGCNMALAVTLQDNSPPNIIPQCYGDATALPQLVTNTTASLLTGMTCNFIPQKNDGTTAANPGGADIIRVTYSVAGYKSTAGYVAVQVFANNGLVADTFRSLATPVSATGTASGTFLIPETVAGPQTIQLDGVSSDTNTGTITGAHWYVEEISRASLKN